jgi:chromosome segregation ATPase
MADRNVSVVIRQAHEEIAKAKKVYEASFEKLLARMTSKMTTFAGQHAGLAKSHEQLMQQVGELQSNFQKKSQEVDGLLQKIEELKASATSQDAEMGRKIEELGSQLTQMKQELEAKAEEASQLSGQLDQVKGQAGSAVEEYAGYVDELANAHETLVSKYNALADDYEKLAKLSQGATKVDLSHTKSKGEFDLVEHLAIALQKNKTKRIWGDW